MSLSKSQLALFIKDLECRQANLVADKYTKSLKYGTGCIDCLHRKITFARGAIGVLKRFFEDGKICTSCELESGQWIVHHVCGYINSPYTSYVCYYTYVDTSVQDIINGVFEFTDGTVNLTKQDGSETQGSYTYNETTGSLTLTISAFPYASTVVFSDDCSELTISYDDPATARTIIVTLNSSTTQSGDCDWNEHCLTEEEAVDLYKNTSSIIGKKCNCH